MIAKLCQRIVSQFEKAAAAQKQIESLKHESLLNWK